MTVTIGRRELLAALGGAAVAWPLAARAQQVERMRRIGVLMALAANDPEGRARIKVFEQGLNELGWSVDRNLRIDYRWAAGDTNRYRSYAAELLALAPDVVVAAGSAAMGALQQAPARARPRVRARKWLGKAVAPPLRCGLREEKSRNP